MSCRSPGPDPLAARVVQRLCVHLSADPVSEDVHLDRRADLDLGRQVGMAIDRFTV